MQQYLSGGRRKFSFLSPSVYPRTVPFLLPQKHNKHDEIAYTLSRYIRSRFFWAVTLEVIVCSNFEWEKSADKTKEWSFESETEMR